MDGPLQALKLMATPAGPPDDAERSNGDNRISQDATQLLLSSPAESPPPMARIPKKLREMLVEKCK